MQVAGGGHVEALAARLGYDRSSQRVLGVLLDCSGDFEDAANGHLITFGFQAMAERSNPDNLWLTLRERAGFIEHDCTDGAQLLQVRPALDQYAVSCCGRNGRYGCDRSRHNESARTADDQQRQRAVKPVLPRST